MSFGELVQIWRKEDHFLRRDGQLSLLSPRWSTSYSNYITTLDDFMDCFIFGNTCRIPIMLSSQDRTVGQMTGHLLGCSHDLDLPAFSPQIIEDEVLSCLSHVMNPPSNTDGFLQLLSRGDDTIGSVFFNKVGQRCADMELVRIRVRITRLAKFQNLLGTIGIVELSEESISHKIAIIV